MTQAPDPRVVRELARRGAPGFDRVAVA